MSVHVDSSLLIRMVKGERCVFRGGRWSRGANAGLFSLNGYNARSNSASNIGFRSAFVRYSGDSGDLDNLDTDSTDRQPEQKEPESYETLPGLVRSIMAGQLANRRRIS